VSLSNGTKCASSASAALTLRAAVRQFLDWLRIECGLADNTLTAYETDLRDLLGFLADKGLHEPAEVRIGHVEQWLRSLCERSYATSSIARKLAVVRMLWKFLHGNGYVAGEVVDLLASPRTWHRLPRIVGQQQVFALLEAPNKDDPLYLRDRAILELFYAAGLRAGELAGLRLGNVNLQVGFVRCVGKGRRERVVPVGGPAVAAVRDYIEILRPRLAHDTAQDHLFLSRTGKALDRHNIYRLVRKYALRAGLSVKVTPHTLRHCFASHLLAGGADLRIVQELLGHASVTTTQIYTHVNHARLKRIHQRFHPRS